MMVWTAFAVMAAVAVAVLLAPLWRSASAEVPGRANYNLAVFRDQLAELDRDRVRGLIGGPEAEAARNEISRRMIEAGAQTKAVPQPQPARRLVHILSALLVPAIAVSIYLREGSPDLPDVPRAARLAEAAETGDFAALIAKVEEYLATNPGDAEGWGVLAPAYKREGRWQDAANAYGQILRLTKPTAESLSDFAEMLVFAGNGLVTADARKTFSEAAALDPKSPRPRFYLALALKQEGKVAEAKAGFEALLADSSADAPWRPLLVQELESLGDDQRVMIRAMVDGLDERLKANGDDLEGWLRLIRSRTVLNEADRAKAALATARQQFKDNAQALSALEALANELNLN